MNREAKIALAADQLQRMARDAARYRALRASLVGISHTEMPMVVKPFTDGLTYTADGLDAAIDAAMADMADDDGSPPDAA